MDLDFIARLLDLVERSEIAELDLTLDGARLRLVKRHGTAPPRLEAAPALPPAGPGHVPAAPQTASPKMHAIRAGFPGTFYRAAAPGEKPFASEGERVEEGRQLAILEAMKTMNPVEADIGGRLARVAAADGQAVETGDLLFEIEPDAP